MIALLIAAAGVPYGGQLPLPAPLSSRGEARTVIDRQLQVPPRQGPRGGVSPEEAERIMNRYLGTIGVMMQPTSTTRSGTPQ
jgi:hypothetical protein